jgi:hypothetical protein
MYKVNSYIFALLVEIILISTGIRPSVAQSVPQLSENRVNFNPQIINGLYNLEQHNFFREGREQFDREIKQLNEQSRGKPDNLLQVSPEIKQIQRRLTPLESPELLHPQS